MLKKLVSLVLLTAVLTSPLRFGFVLQASAAEGLSNDPAVIATAILGEKTETDGCKVWQVEENKPMVQNRGGRDGWLLDPGIGTPNRHICVDIDDSAFSNLADGSNFEVIVSYFDESNGTITMEYPSYVNYTLKGFGATEKRNTSTTIEMREQMHSSEMWKEAVFLLEKPTLKNELEKADFRIGIYTEKMGFLQNGTVVISKIEVKKTGTYSRYKMNTTCENIGYNFFTGQPMKFTVEMDNTVYPEYAKAEGEYDVELTWTLRDKYGAVYRQKKNTARIKPLEKIRQSVVFDDVKDYGLYTLTVEAENSEKHIYASDFRRCAYVITTYGKIRNPKGGLNVSVRSTDDESIAELVYNAGFTKIACTIPIAQWGRVAYATDWETASEFSPSQKDLQLWNTYSGYDFDMETYVHGTEWEGGLKTTIDGISDRVVHWPTTERGAKNFAKYNTKAKEIMGDSMDNLSISNEINIAFVLNDDRWAEAMANAQKESYQAIKKEFPDMKVGGPNAIVIGNSYDGWLENFLKAGAGKYMDFLSLHPYFQLDSTIATNGWYDDRSRGGTFKEQVELLEKYGVDVPVYATEYGASALYYNCHSTQMQANWNIQQYMQLMQEDLFDAAYVFQLTDLRYGKAGVTKENCFGLLRGLTERDDPLYYATAKEGYLAYSNLNIQMADAEYVARRDFDDKMTVMHRWKKTDTGEDMLTIASDCDLVHHTFDLGTDSVILVDMYGNERKVMGKNGVFTFSVTGEMLYIKGHFGKMIHLEHGVVAPELAEYSASPGYTVTIGIRNPSDNICDISVEPAGTSSVVVKEISADAVVLDIGRNIIADSETIRITMSNECGTMFFGDVILKYSNKIKLKQAVSKNSDGEWELRTTISNDDKRTYTGELRIMGPSIWADSVQSESITIEPGETIEVAQKFIKNMEDRSGDAVSFGFIIDPQTLSGVFNSTKLDFLYAAKANSEMKIDAELSEWANACWVKANKTDMFETVVGYNNEYKGTKDISGEVAVMWDKENMYFAGRVYDDVHYCENTHAGNMWSMDSIQLAFIYDPENSASVNVFEEVAMGILDGKPTIYRHKTTLDLTGDKVKDIEGAEFFARREGTTTFYELKLPWKTVVDRYDEIKGGTIIKTAFLINENDGTGRKGYYSIGTEIAKTKNNSGFLKLYCQD